MGHMTFQAIVLVVVVIQVNLREPVGLRRVLPVASHTTGWRHQRDINVGVDDVVAAGSVAGLA